MSSPVFFCEAIAQDVVELTGPEGRHAAAVRRIRAGEVIELVDGRGLRCTCTVLDVRRDSLTCEVTARALESAPQPRLVLVQALAKGGRGELAVELATEVGVDEIVPWAASRSIAKADGPLSRWQSTAHEAAKQSRRSWFPTVTPVLTTEQVAQLSGHLLVLHESAASPLSQIALPAGDLVLVVGPEGGLTDEELGRFTTAGASVVRLGGTVLRTSTAGAAAIAVVSSRTGRW